MSIQTELTRITNAKAAIKTAIEGKGVTVPDGTLLDGMAALIEAIQAGGGGDICGSKYVCGTFTPSEDITTTYTVNHDPLTERETKTPDLIFLWTGADSTLGNGGSWTANAILGAACISYRYSDIVQRAFYYNYVVNSSGQLEAQKNILFDYHDYGFPEYFKIKATSTLKLAAGKDYYWLRVPNRA